MGKRLGALTTAGYADIYRAAEERRPDQIRSSGWPRIQDPLRQNYQTNWKINHPGDFKAPPWDHEQGGNAQSHTLTHYDENAAFIASIFLRSCSSSVYSSAVMTICSPPTSKIA